MQTTGIFTTHEVKIQFDKYNDPIYVIPFGDVHRDAPGHALERWKEFLKWAKKKPRCYFLGMGDYHDFASTSERAILGDPRLHESTRKTLEYLYYNQCHRFAKEIEFMEGRIIGLIEGNHYQTFANNTTTTQELCRLLNAPYLGVMSVIRLSFVSRRNNTRLSLDLVAHHGKGAARLVGGSLNRVQQMAEAVEADIYLMGHDHKKSVASSSVLKITDGSDGKIRLKHRKKIYARTGSFLRGYRDGEASYITDAAGNPTDLGVVKLEITPRRNRGDKKDVRRLDIHVSI